MLMHPNNRGVDHLHRRIMRGEVALGKPDIGPPASDASDGALHGSVKLTAAAIVCAMSNFPWIKWSLTEGVICRRA